MKRIIEVFQMECTPADAPRLGRPHNLLDDQTKIAEHTYENPGTFTRRIVQELSHKHEMVDTTVEKEAYFPCRISVLYQMKPEDYTPAATSKQ